MEAVYQELKGIGIDATLDDIPNTQWLSNLELGQFQMSICYSQSGPSSFYIYNGFLNSANTAAIGQLAPTNYDRFSSPQADALISTYVGTDNIAIQKKAMYGLESIMASQIPVMPLFYQTDWGEYNTTNITGWPTASNPYDLASTYDTPMNEVVLLHLSWR
jgi:peptide/nickel transport system substrate-binding protein